MLVLSNSGKLLREDLKVRSKTFTIQFCEERPAKNFAVSKIYLQENPLPPTCWCF